MKTKVYLFRLIVAVVTLTLGIGIYCVWQGFTAEPIPEISQVEQPVVEIITPEALAEFAKEETELPKEDEAIEDEFSPDGDYYLIGDLPKAFKDFDYLNITATKYDEKADGSAYANPIPPVGAIFTKKEFKFKRININNRQISFETETVKGISYKFIGFFPKELSSNEEEDFTVIQGTLTKIKNGKKVAEIQARFGYIHGC